jgi:hypothetical protein
MDQKEQKVMDFGTITQISASMKERLFLDEFENIIKEGLRRNAQNENYVEVSPPEIFWSEQAWKIVGNGEEGFRKVACNPTDEGAFFDVGAKMKVVKNADLPI